MHYNPPILKYFVVLVKGFRCHNDQENPNYSEEDEQ